MTLKELIAVRSRYLSKFWEYERTYYKDFDYSVLDNCIYRKSMKGKKEDTFNDITLMIDTETSKPEDYREDYKDNYVVVWTLSIRLFDLNIATLYGRKPSELVECMETMISYMKGDKTYFYIFNLSYDYVFLRKFFMKKWGFPKYMLNVKPHYPISIEYENGIVLKDALILAQRKLSKWAMDMCVEHQKAIGDWDYNTIRHQDTYLTDEELHYAEYDTLVGVECIDALKNQLHKNIGTMPLTSTGILREIIRKAGAQNKAKEWFKKCLPTFNQYTKLKQIYHGGYTHGFREHLNETIKGFIKGYDFASSYPYVLFEKYPTGHFIPISNKSPEFILKYAEKYAFMFKLILVDVELKLDVPMPYLQYSKCETINELVDNGRIIAADFVSLYTNEIDLELIMSQYDIKKSICIEVEVAKKDYLPRWFTDIVFDLFKDKTTLKGSDDEVLYTIKKYTLNACYGLCSQLWDKPLIIETEDGEYIEDDSKSSKELYEAHIKKRSTILPYFIGCWCTSYAVRDLFKLGSMCETWLYSDTDSCYGLNWDEDKVAAYNQSCIDFIESRGYSGVLHKGKMYYLGVAETEPKTQYTEFRYHGAKRYAGRCVADGDIHITVAGVPKKNGAKCLKSIDDFDKDFVFKGTITKKLTHTHQYVDDIYINAYGDEVADSIDLTPCDYKLDTAKYHSIFEYINGGYDIEIQVAQDIEDFDFEGSELYE